MTKALKIDFVSDVSCPWCAIGLQSLNEAIKRVGPDISVELHFQPFELNPKMAAEGQDITEHITQKYGISQEQAHSNRENIRVRGAELGFKFSAADEPGGGRNRIYNTFDAHRLLHWAQTISPAMQKALKEALLKAYFTDGQSPGSHEVLARVAGSVGLDVVKANETNLVIVNRTSPIFAIFNVPEAHLGTIRRLQSAGRLPVRASLKDTPTAVSMGSLAVIDNAVDAATGSIRLKATFANQDRMFWPGQFVDVVLGLGTVMNATVVPSEAVQPGQKGPYVYRVKADQSVEVQLVTVGETYKNQTVVTGLAPGDVVVLDGQLRLAPGMKVRKTTAAQAGAGE